MSVLGLVKHLTAVQRQHIQVHIGGRDLPLLGSHEDTTADFLIQAGETVASVVAAYYSEWQLSHLGHLDIVRELIDGTTGE